MKMSRGLAMASIMGLMMGGGYGFGRTINEDLTREDALDLKKAADQKYAERIAMYKHRRLNPLDPKYRKTK